MPTFSSFAIAGVGILGSVIAKGLLKYRASGHGQVTDVVLLTRSISNNALLAPLAGQGATVIQVDYTSVTNLTEVFTTHKVDVIFALQPPGASIIDASAIKQIDLLAEAAKAAGVKLFVPPEYGSVSTNAEDPETEAFFRERKRVHQMLKMIDLPYALFFTGPWTDYCLVDPGVGVDFKTRKAMVGGDGNTLISWTDHSDVGAFVAYVVATLPAAQLQWQTFRIEGDRKSFNQIFEEYEKRTGKKIDVTYHSIEDLKVAVERNPRGEFVRALHWMWAIGDGLVGGQDQLSNGLFPGWDPKKVIDVVAP